MTSNVFSKLLASAPVNKQAAMSSSKGFAYTPSKVIVVQEWDAPPRMKEPVRNQLDLRGTRTGRLVVIGLLADLVVNKNTRATWVCRCDCGRYTSRKAKSINNPRNEGDRCELCRHARFLSERHKTARKVVSREQQP